MTNGSVLSSATAVCVQHSIEDTIAPDYPRFLQAQFGGELFSSSDIVSVVNEWVKKNTNGLIDKAADESMRNMPACLINATAFEDEFFTGFVKPYKDEKYVFMALLPKKKKSASFLLRALKQIDFLKMFNKSVYGTVYVTIPERHESRCCDNGGCRCGMCATV